MDTSIERLLDDDDLSKMLNVGKRTPADWRRSGTGPAYIRIGPRLIRYKASAVKAFIDEAGCQSATEIA